MNQIRLPKYHIGDTVCFWARTDSSQSHELFVMTIRRLFQRHGLWYYDMEGDFYEIEGWAECNIIGKCTL